MLVDLSIISDDVLVDRIDGSCYDHEFTIDRSRMESDGWQESDYDVVITLSESATGGHPYSYPQVVTFTAIDDNADEKEDSITVWVNFILII